MTTRILVGDVRQRLQELPTASIHCCVTSPPYYGLRAYLPDGHTDKAYELGLEPTLAEYITNMVDVFREVRRVLRDDGVCFVNIGDSYAGGGRGGHSDHLHGTPPQGIGNGYPKSSTPDGLKPKDLMLVPERLALALQDDGWWVRSRIIWAKKACMPESVTDRPTNAHEHIWLLTKAARYFYDAEAVREGDEVYTRKAGGYGELHIRPGRNVTRNEGGLADRDTTTVGRNQRNVWKIPTPLARLRSDLPHDVKLRVIGELIARGLL